MAQISLFLAKLEARLASLALGVVILSVLCGILSRILPLPTVTWSTELSGLAFTWAVFIGCALAFKRGLHVSIPILQDMAPPSLSVIWVRFVALSSCLFFVSVAWLSFELTLQSLDRPSPVMRVPFTVVYAPVAYSFLSMAFETFLQIIAVEQINNEVQQ